MVKGVIFDMDGTMFGTEQVSTTAWLEAGEQLNIEITEEVIDLFRGRGPEAIKEIFLEKYGADADYESLKNLRNELYIQHLERDGVPIKEGLMNLLEYLRTEKIPMAVATSTSEVRARKILKLAGVYDYFTGFVFGDTLTVSKPKPDIFLEAARRIACNPKECLVLEDSTAGVQAGKAAGGYIIHIPDMIEVPKEVKEGITAELEDLNQVAAWIKDNRR